MMRLIVDRIEEGLAVCEEENGSMQSLPLSLLPPGIREGSVIRKEGGRYLADPEGEARRREALAAKRRKLFQKTDL